MPTTFAAILLDLHRRTLKRARRRCLAWAIGLWVVGLWIVAELHRPACVYPRRMTARDDARQLELAIEQFRLEWERCPHGLGELIAVGRLYRGRLDPWGRQYEIACSDEQERVRVCSRGPDTVAEDDDVCSDDRRQ
jgi:hypothetical protein